MGPCPWLGFSSIDFMHRWWGRPGPSNLCALISCWETKTFWFEFLVCWEREAPTSYIPHTFKFRLLQAVLSGGPACAQSLLHERDVSRLWAMLYLATLGREVLYVCVVWNWPQGRFQRALMGSELICLRHCYPACKYNRRKQNIWTT